VKEQSRQRERRIRLRMRLKRIPKIPAVIILLLLICSVFSPWIAPHDPTAQSLSNALKAPAWQSGGSWSYVLGTDALGRDVLSRTVYGSRISVIVGFAAVFVAAFIGTLLGMIAGYFGGWVDAVIMRFTDIMLSLPYILIAIAIIGAIGPGLFNIILVLGATQWVGYTRIVRFESMRLSTAEFVDMATISGSSRFRNLFVHILPNVLNSAVVLATLDVGKMIIFEAALSFLGLGVQPPTVTWGGLLADGRSFLSMGWWIATFPGAAIVLTVLAGNLIGDWLRDELDPRHQMRA
jgi:peptide/nickel transport system permease protein